jgi:NAD-dependent dihydropyrimidine dehydrogenase PreA subunit
VDCINIVDARGRKFSPGKLIFGVDGHSVDYICAQIAGINPDRIPTLKLAREQGLFDPKDIEIQGRFQVIKGYAVPFRFPFRSSIVQSVAQVLYRIWLARMPVIDGYKCTDCRLCEDVCPAQCIKRRHIDYKKCIKCYCCIEVCPNQAIKTRFRF